MRHRDAGGVDVRLGSLFVLTVPLFALLLLGADGGCGGSESSDTLKVEGEPCTRPFECASFLCVGGMCRSEDAGASSDG